MLENKDTSLFWAPEYPEGSEGPWCGQRQGSVSYTHPSVDKAVMGGPQLFPQCLKERGTERNNLRTHICTAFLKGLKSPFGIQMSVLLYGLYCRQNTY